MMGVDEFERSPDRVAENKFVIMDAGSYSITYYNQEVQDAVLGLPDKLAARYVFLTTRMLAVGAHLGAPHTTALGNGLFELRLKSPDGIARAMYGTLVGRRIVVLHVFIKKTQKIPRSEISLAYARLKRVLDEDA